MEVIPGWPLPDLCDTFPESDTGQSGVMDTEDLSIMVGGLIS